LFLADIGNAEVALGGTGLLGALGGVVTFFLRQALGDVRALQATVASQTTAIEILKAQSLHDQVADHGQRLSVIELGLSEIKGDLRFVKQWVERQQSDHRRPEQG
jgi:hypothetical protein